MPAPKPKPKNTGGKQAKAAGAKGHHAHAGAAAPTSAQRQKEELSKARLQAEARAFEVINLRTLLLKIEKERGDLEAQVEALEAEAATRAQELASAHAELAILRKDATRMRMSLSATPPGDAPPEAAADGPASAESLGAAMAAAHSAAEELAQLQAERDQALSVQRQALADKAEAEARSAALERERDQLLEHAAQTEQVALAVTGACSPPAAAAAHLQTGEVSPVRSRASSYSFKWPQIGSPTGLTRSGRLLAKATAAAPPQDLETMKETMEKLLEEKDNHIQLRQVEIAQLKQQNEELSKENTSLRAAPPAAGSGAASAAPASAVAADAAPTPSARAAKPRLPPFPLRGSSRPTSATAVVSGDAAAAATSAATAPALPAQPTVRLFNLPSLRERERQGHDEASASEVEEEDALTRLRALAREESGLTSSVSTAGVGVTCSELREAEEVASAGSSQGNGAAVSVASGARSAPGGGSGSATEGDGGGSGGDAAASAAAAAAAAATAALGAVCAELEAALQRSLELLREQAQQQHARRRAGWLRSASLSALDVAPIGKQQLGDVDAGLPAGAAAGKQQQQLGEVAAGMPAMATGAAAADPELTGPRQAVPEQDQDQGWALVKMELAIQQASAASSAAERTLALAALVAQQLQSQSELASQRQAGLDVLAADHRQMQRLVHSMARNMARQARQLEGAGSRAGSARRATEGSNGQGPAAGEATATQAAVSVGQEQQQEQQQQQQQQQQRQPASESAAQVQEAVPTAAPAGVQPQAAAAAALVAADGAGAALSAADVQAVLRRLRSVVLLYRLELGTAAAAVLAETDRRPAAEQQLWLAVHAVLSALEARGQTTGHAASAAPYQGRTLAKSPSSSTRRSVAASGSALEASTGPSVWLAAGTVSGPSVLTAAAVLGSPARRGARHGRRATWDAGNLDEDEAAGVEGEAAGTRGASGGGSGGVTGMTASPGGGGFGSSREQLPRRCVSDDMPAAAAAAAVGACPGPGFSSSGGSAVDPEAGVLSCTRFPRLSEGLLPLLHRKRPVTAGGNPRRTTSASFSRTPSADIGPATAVQPLPAPAVEGDAAAGPASATGSEPLQGSSSSSRRIGRPFSANAVGWGRPPNARPASGVHGAAAANGALPPPVTLQHPHSLLTAPAAPHAHHRHPALRPLQEVVGPGSDGGVEA